MYTYLYLLTLFLYGTNRYDDLYNKLAWVCCNALVINSKNKLQKPSRMRSTGFYGGFLPCWWCFTLYTFLFAYTEYLQITHAFISDRFNNIYRS